MEMIHSNYRFSIIVSFWKIPLEYPELGLDPLNPFKPKGAHDSFTVRVIDSGLGINVDGVASKISVYGFDKSEIQQIEYVHS